MCPMETAQTKQKPYQVLCLTLIILIIKRKHTCLHAIQHADHLNEEKILDQALKQYLRGNMPWANIAKFIATEESE